MNDPPTPILSRDSSIVGTSSDIDTVKQARDLVMQIIPPDDFYATSSTSQSFRQAQQNAMERHLFVPGLTILARSDEETNPLKIEEIRELIQQQPNTDFWREVDNHRTRATKRVMERTIYPEADDIISTYWREYGVFIREIDVIHISGWHGSDEGAKEWLQFCTADEHGMLKQMAKDVGALLERRGYPEMACIIMRYSRYYPR